MLSKSSCINQPHLHKQFPFCEEEKYVVLHNCDRLLSCDWCFQNHGFVILYVGGYLKAQFVIYIDLKSLILDSEVGGMKLCFYNSAVKYNSASTC